MSQTNRWRQRLDDLRNASDRLNEAFLVKDISDLEKDGVIQRFEFTFELAWKTLKDYLEDQGLTDVSSPKKALQTAFEQNLIENGDAWLKILNDRNRMSHLYDKSASDEIFASIADEYVGLINSLVDKLSQE